MWTKHQTPLAWRLNKKGVQHRVFPMIVKQDMQKVLRYKHPSKKFPVNDKVFMIQWKLVVKSRYWQRNSKSDCYSWHAWRLIMQQNFCSGFPKVNLYSHFEPNARTKQNSYRNQLKCLSKQRIIENSPKTDEVKNMKKNFTFAFYLATVELFCTEFNT